MLKTKWNIAQTYLELVKEHSLLNVTNDDIINHSDVSRGTFYNNFNGQKSIQDYIQEKIANDIITPIKDDLDTREINTNDIHQAVLDISDSLIPTLYHHREMIKLLNDCELNHIWEDLLLDVMTEYMAPVLKNNRGSIKNDRIMLNYINLIIESWITEDNPTDPEAFKAILYQLSKQSITQLL
ncbi:TetR/AcrR family transcriptional regulator [Lactobacillus sp. Sy-1]|uniref:TetR/AcrR family transcriptional regulator n=1 Tax=Lactobacillus sp. Sy-1 TaxID=2109645 RepID=UPI001C57E76B|nr:TetR/AcrR family transcriptional regulator [Lactobacillus sp. Sy-1]MBW1605146.1 TetR/AcrR family transcriptional regulator [Lactobacillus sp. Sy-1]